MYSISEFAGLLVKQAREEKQWDQQYLADELDMEPADPRHRAVRGHGETVLSPRLYRLLGRRAVFAPA